MATEVLNRPSGYLFGKFDGENFFGFADMVARIADERIYRGQTVLYRLYPLFVESAESRFFARLDGCDPVRKRGLYLAENVVTTEQFFERFNRVVVRFLRGFRTRKSVVLLFFRRKFVGTVVRFFDVRLLVLAAFYRSDKPAVKQLRVGVKREVCRFYSGRGAGRGG